MSCTSKTKPYGQLDPYIKIGDSFDVPVQLVDSETGDGVPITIDMVITSSIVNISGNVIGTPTITPYSDQVTDAGFILLSVPTSVTSTWSVGKAKFDIKIVIGDSVRHSSDFPFEIKQGITL